MTEPRALSESRLTGQHSKLPWRMMKFKNVIRRLENGYIAAIDKSSVRSEQLAVAKFSEKTKNLLGLGVGYLGIPRELTPLVKADDWDENHPWSDYPGPHKLHVFVVVLNNEIVGYMPVQWHWNINQRGRLLDWEGKPIESGGRLVIINIGDESPVDENDEPKRLESWGIEGICILPEWQRHGLGKLLVTTGLNFLGTNEKDVAWDPPFTEAGKALLRSLGLNLEDIRLSLGI